MLFKRLKYNQPGTVRPRDIPERGKVMKRNNSLRVLIILLVCGPMFLVLPSCRTARDYLAASARADGPEERIRAADRAIEIGGLPASYLSMAYNNRAWGWLDLHQPVRAMEDLHQALALDANNAYAYNNLGLALIEDGRAREAVDVLTKAARLAPDNVLIWVNRGLAYNDLEKFPEALADSKRALAIDPGQPMALINRGHAYHEMGYRDQALADCEAAVKSDPEHPVALNSLAFLLATCPKKTLRDGPRAVRLAEKAVAISPGTVMIWDTLAASYTEAGRLRGGLSNSEKGPGSAGRKGDPPGKEAKGRLFATVGRD